MSNQIPHYIIWDAVHPNGNHEQIQLWVLKTRLLYSCNGLNNGEHCKGYVPEFKNKYFCIHEHNWILLIIFTYSHVLHSGCFFSWNATIFCASNILKCHLWHSCCLLTCTPTTLTHCCYIMFSKMVSLLVSNYNEHRQIKTKIWSSVWYL
jgi:hypothetical protein